MRTLAERADAALHRHAPHSRGHQPAGLRDAARSRAEGEISAAHVRHRRPHRPDRQPGRAVRRSAGRGNDRGAASATSRTSASPISTSAAASRASSTSSVPSRASPSRAPPSPAATRTPRRTARSAHRLRHRHHPGARRARHPDAWRIEQLKVRRINVDGELAPRRLRQGRDPPHHPPARRQGRHRLRLRVRRRSHRPHVDGGAHDRLQHVDRRRRPLRLRQPGREDLRLPEGPPVSPAGRGVRRGRRVVAGVRRRDADAVYDDVVNIDGRDIAPTVTWGISPGPRHRDHRERSRDPPRLPSDAERASIEEALDYMKLRRRHADQGHARSTSPSSAPAPTAASAISAKSAKYLKGQQRRPAREGASSSPASRSSPRLCEQEGTRRDLHAPPASNGAAPAARCASP